MSYSKNQNPILIFLYLANQFVAFVEKGKISMIVTDEMQYRFSTKPLNVPGKENCGSLPYGYQIDSPWGKKVNGLGKNVV